MEDEMHKFETDSYQFVWGGTRVTPIMGRWFWNKKSHIFGAEGAKKYLKWVKLTHFWRCMQRISKKSCFLFFVTFDRIWEFDRVNCIILFKMPENNCIFHLQQFYMILKFYDNPDLKAAKPPVLSPSILSLIYNHVNLNCLPVDDVMWSFKV